MFFTCSCTDLLPNLLLIFLRHFFADMPGISSISRGETMNAAGRPSRVMAAGFALH